MCAVPGESYLQYEEKVIQCEERVYSTRIATSDVGGQGVWCEEKFYSINNVIPAVLGEKVWSTRKVATTLRGEIKAVTSCSTHKIDQQETDG